MKTINPQAEPVTTQRSFLFYGEPKAGKTSLAMSIADHVKTLFVAAERDGWQDAYAQLSEKGKQNVQVVELNDLNDVKELHTKIPEDVKVVVVDSFTAIMNFIEVEIKKLGGKHILAGLTNKLALNSYGDLANLSIQFLQNLKATGKHLIFTAGVDKEYIETTEGNFAKRMPLLVGNKTANTLPYEIRAIGYLRDVNGKRELWFQSSQQWLAGSNYKSLVDARVIENPDMAKVFTLFPKLKKNGIRSTKEVPSDQPE